MLCTAPPNYHCINGGFLDEPGVSAYPPFHHPYFYNNKTVLSADEGETFQELAEPPFHGLGQCAVFIDDNTLMVMGGGQPEDSFTDDGTWSSNRLLLVLKELVPSYFGFPFWGLE